MSKHLNKWLLLCLLLGGLITHFIGLTQPKQVIFDEVHFGKFVTAYCCTGERIFDIHPPHVKLLIAGAARLGGYKGGFPFENIGQPYGDVPIFWLRLVPALSGVLLPFIIYVLLRQLGARWPLSLLGALAMLFDNSLTIQTRIIALDGTLLVATFGSLSAYLMGEKRHGWQRWLWFIAAGALAGLAVGSKFTGLSAIALLGVVVIVRIWQDRQQWQSWVWSGVLIVASAIVIYLAGWIGHYVLLTNPGFGDAFHTPDLTGAPLPVAFLRDVWELHRVMFSANYNLTATHPYESAWWTWPLMLRPVFYWQAPDSYIYFIGNPVVWWGGFFLFLMSISALVIRFAWRNKYEEANGEPVTLWIPIIGYIIAMAPLMRVPRALFLYHYLTPLIFSIIIGLLWMQLEGFFRQPFNKAQRYVYIFVIALIIVMFLFFSPLTYGYPISQFWHNSLLWLPKTWI